MAYILLLSGIAFTFITRGVQFTRFLDMLKTSLGSFGKRDSRGVSGFEALSTALAGAVGTGNIAGVASAIAIGGAGAIFWMWVSALLGMATKYAEVVTAMRYRVAGNDGEKRGGAMYCILHGMGKRFKPLAAVFCVLLMIASLFCGNMVQVNTMASAVAQAADAYSADVNRIPELITGVLTAVFIVIAMVGGLKRVSRLTSFIVPFMSIAYIAATLLVISINSDKVMWALRTIVDSAFLSPQQAAGGVMGYGIMRSMRTGVDRGTFSNEAGIGSTPIAHAAAEASEHTQGLMGIAEVFIDTIVICTLTAVMVLVSGVYIPLDANADGMAIAVSALATAIGREGSGIFMSISSVLFAFSSMLGWSLYGRRAAEFLGGRCAVKMYCAVYVLCIIPGALMEVGTVWRIGEAANAAMAVPNLIMLFTLAPVMGYNKLITKNKRNLCLTK